eukprot:2511911-Alexandrium_andersonii.AAC.1
MVTSTASYWWPPRARRIGGSAAVGQLCKRAAPHHGGEEGPAPRPTREQGGRGVTGCSRPLGAKGQELSLIHI